MCDRTSQTYLTHFLYRYADLTLIGSRRINGHDLCIGTAPYTLISGSIIRQTKSSGCPTQNIGSFYRITLIIDHIIAGRPDRMLHLITCCGKKNAEKQSDYCKQPCPFFHRTESFFHLLPPFSVMKSPGYYSSQL